MTGSPPAAAPRPAAARWRPAAKPPVLRHLAALAVLLVVVAPLVDLDTAWISDEGRYALQAEALREDGTWEWEAGTHAPPVDVDGADDVFGPGAREPHVPYPHHPLWAMLLAGATSLFGVAVGLHLLSAAAVVGLAAVAWRLTERLGAPPALGFWLAALSPALVNGFLAWAHTASAALAGLVVLLALRLVGPGGSAGTWAALAVAVAAGALLRSESLLFAAAVVVVHLGLAALGRSRRAALAVAAVAGLAAAAAEGGERLWIRSITDSSGAEVARAGAEGLGDLLAGRLGAARQVLLEGGDLAAGGLLLSLVSLALTAVAVVLLRRGGLSSRAGILLAVAAAVYLVRAAVEPANTVSGLLAAWPVAVAGLALLAWRPVRAEVAVVLATAAVFAGAVLAVQYEQGGAFEWGGRFLSPVTALLAAAAAVGLHRAPAARAPVARAGLVSLAVAPAVAGVTNLAAVRAEVDDVEAAVRAQPAEVVVTDNESLPYRLWPTLDRHTWVVVEPADLEQVAGELAARGPVAVVADPEHLGPGARSLGQDLAILAPSNARSAGGR